MSEIETSRQKMHVLFVVILLYELAMVAMGVHEATCMPGTSQACGPTAPASWSASYLRGPLNVVPSHYLPLLGSVS